MGATPKSRRFRRGGVTPQRPGKRKAPARVDGAPGPARSNWQDAVLARIRRLIREADPDAVEERKWRKPSNPDGVPVWSHDGILCTGEAHTSHVRLTFARGASLQDPRGVFNSGFEGNARRAIVLREGDALDGDGFKALIRAAAALNASSAGD